MKKKLAIVAIGALVLSCLLMGSTALAGNGNDMPSGQHYNLNIIAKDKHADVGDSSGHTMFVKDDGRTKIIMTQDDDGEFYVVDRNGLDGRAEFNIAPGYYDVYARALGKPGGKVNITANGTFNDSVTGEKLIKLGNVALIRDKGKPQSVNINELFYVDVCVNTTGGYKCYEDVWVFDIEELLEYYWDYDNDGLKLLQVRFYENTTYDPNAHLPTVDPL